MANNKQFEIDTSFDFGFSAVDESELESIKVLEQKAKETETAASMTQNKLEAMYKLIVPLIDNLMKDPDKSCIYWPDRQAKLQAFKKKLQTVVQG